MSLPLFFFGGQMGFHEQAIFPTTISVGSSGGPRFNTQVVELDGGGEHRLARWSDPLRTYDVRGGMKTQADAYTVLEFFHARLGATYGFKYKDWNDYATTNTGSTYRDDDNAVDKEDTQCVIYNPGGADHGLPATGNSLRTQFQLVKRYTSGGIERIRLITKPIASSVVVAHATVSVSNWTVNETNGVITFTTAPAVGIITWGGEFYVPCRFGTDVDRDGLAAQADDYDNFTNPNVTIQEIKNGLDVPEERYTGGAKNWGQVALDVTLTIGLGAAHSIEPTTDIDVFLPDADLLPPGIGYFHILNNGGIGDLIVKSPDLTTLATITPDTSLFVDLVTNAAGTPEWLGML